jgi:hypothetical protein
LFTHMFLVTATKYKTYFFLQTRGKGLDYHIVLRFVSTYAKFGICAVVGLNGTLAEAKIRTWDT